MAILFTPAVLATQPVQAQTYTVLYSFTKANGPSAAGLIGDATGNLYGTSQGGSHTHGMVFKLDPSGAESRFHHFKGAPVDGSTPLAALVQDAQGNFYGTTGNGGSACAPYGCGTVFKIDTRRRETVLYSFTGTGGDGFYPTADLALDKAGNLYGTTAGGGNDTCLGSCGTVFKLDHEGNETVLYRFTGTGGDGYGPYAGLVQDGRGNLYGTTMFGGDLTCTSPGCGTVFKLDKNLKETVLYIFNGNAGDGYYPSGLIRDRRGNLYGTTRGGGLYNHGIVFKLDTTGQETVLYSFTGTGGDGATPSSDLVRDQQGNLYGTTFFGGDLTCFEVGYGCGTVFELDKNGMETVLHAFNGTDGANPLGTLLLGDQGNLYGTTSSGLYSWGNVFKITP